METETNQHYTYFLPHNAFPLDQWSFGITCWEVFSGGKMPYPAIPPFSLLSFLQEGHRLEKPPNAACSDEM